MMPQDFSSSSFQEHFREFLQISSDETPDEDSRLVQLSQDLTISKNVLRIAVFLNPYYFSFSKDKRLEPPNLRNYPYHRRFIRFHNIFGRNSEDGVECPKRFYFILLIWLYLICKLCLTASLQLTYDREFASLQAQIRSIIPKTRKCLSEKQLASINPAKHQKLVDISRWLNELGSPSAAASDILPFAIYAMLFLLIAIYGASWFLERRNRMYLNSITFSYAPVAERIRVEVKKVEAIESLLNANEYKQINISQKSSKQDLSLVHRETQALITSEPKCLCKFRPYCENQYKFERTFSSNQIHKFVKPQHLTSSSYRYLMHSQRVYHTCALILCFSFILSLTWSLATHELLTRRSQRLEETRCRAKDDNLTFVGRSIMMPDLSEFDKRVYASLANSTDKFSSVWMMLIEMKNACSWATLRLASEITFVYTVLAFGTSIHFACIYDGLNYTLIWVRQVQKQLRLCTMLLREFRRMNLLFEGENKKRNNIEAARDKIEFSLAITYINFTLFRKDYRSFRLFLGYFSNAMSIFMLGIATLCYYISSLIDSRTQATMYLVVVMFVSMLNLMGIINGAMMKNIQRIFGDLGEVVAKSCLNGMELSYIVTLLRRQILPLDGVENLFGVRVFGIELNYKNQIQFNSYLLALLVFLLRS